MRWRFIVVMMMSCAWQTAKELSNSIGEQFAVEPGISRHGEHAQNNVKAKGRQGNRIEDIKDHIVVLIAPEILNVRSKQQQENATAHEETPNGTCHDDQKEVLAFVAVDQKLGETLSTPNTTCSKGNDTTSSGSWLRCGCCRSCSSRRCFRIRGIRCRLIVPHGDDGVS